MSATTQPMSHLHAVLKSCPDQGSFEINLLQLAEKIEFLFNDVAFLEPFTYRRECEATPYIHLATSEPVDLYLRYPLKRRVLWVSVDPQTSHIHVFDVDDKEARAIGLRGRDVMQFVCELLDYLRVEKTTVVDTSKSMIWHEGEGYELSFRVVFPLLNRPKKPTKSYYEKYKFESENPERSQAIQVLREVKLVDQECSVVQQALEFVNGEDMTVLPDLITALYSIQRDVQTEKAQRVQACIFINQIFSSLTGAEVCAAVCSLVEIKELVRTRPQS